MHSTIRAIFLAVLLVGSVRANDSLQNARRAQALLGSEVWSQLIRVENSTRLGRYPRTVYALVFELANILWFYTDVDGTQSFSLHIDDVAREKADFAPLLREIDPGFTNWKVVPLEAGESGGRRNPRREPLRNGCFIESVAELSSRLKAGQAVAHPRLLSFYVKTPTGELGHTVLAFDADGESKIVDPAEPAEKFQVSRQIGSDPLAFARAYRGDRITRARTVALDRLAPGWIAWSARPGISAHEASGGGG